MVNIPYYIVYKKYRTSWIRATDKFIDGKISDLLRATHNMQSSQIELRS